MRRPEYTPCELPLEVVERIPSWAALAQAPLDDLENVLRPLGLWRQKALAFQNLTRSLAECGASFPARARNWSACRGSALTRRARC